MLMRSHAGVQLQAVISTCGNQPARSSGLRAHNLMLRAPDSCNATLDGRDGDLKDVAPVPARHRPEVHREMLQARHRLEASGGPSTREYDREASHSRIQLECV